MTYFLLGMYALPFAVSIIFVPHDNRVSNYFIYKVLELYVVFKIAKPYEVPSLAPSSFHVCMA